METPFATPLVAFELDHEDGQRSKHAKTASVKRSRVDISDDDVSTGEVFEDDDDNVSVVFVETDEPAAKQPRLETIYLLSTSLFEPIRVERRLALAYSQRLSDIHGQDTQPHTDAASFHIPATFTKHDIKLLVAFWQYFDRCDKATPSHVATLAQQAPFAMSPSGHAHNADEARYWRVMTGDGATAFTTQWALRYRNDATKSGYDVRKQDVALTGVGTLFAELLRCMMVAEYFESPAVVHMVGVILSRVLTETQQHHPNDHAGLRHILQPIIDNGRWPLQESSLRWIGIHLQVGSIWNLDKCRDGDDVMIELLNQLFVHATSAVFHAAPKAWCSFVDALSLFYYDAAEPIHLCPPSFTHLVVQDTRVTVQQLNLLANACPSLRTLALVGCGIDNQGLQHVGRLTRLTHLDIRGNPLVSLPDTTLTETLRNIKTLHSDGRTAVRQLGDAFLAQLTSLSGGYVGCAISAAKLANLTSLSLQAELPTVLTLIGNLRNGLKSLDVSFTRLRGIEEYPVLLQTLTRQHPRIASLRLDWNSCCQHVTPVESLANVWVTMAPTLPNLTSLSISGLATSVDAVNAIGRHLTNLVGLDLSCVGLDPRHVDFSAFRNLRHLDLSANPNVGDSTVMLVAHHLRRLQSLNVSQTSVTSIGLAQIVKIRTLTRLDISRCLIADDGLCVLTDLPHLSDLRVNFKTHAARVLAKHCPSLTRLDTADSIFGVPALRALLAGIPELRVLDMRDSKVSAKAFEELVGGAITVAKVVLPHHQTRNIASVRRRLREKHPSVLFDFSVTAPSLSEQASP